MSDCELISRCLFFNGKMADMPAVAQFMKRRSCRGTKAERSRFMVISKLGRSNVPMDLFPDETARAKTILVGK